MGSIDYRCAITKNTNSKVIPPIMPANSTFTAVVLFRFAIAISSTIKPPTIAISNPIPGIQIKESPEALA